MKFLVNKLLDHQKDSGKSKNPFQSVINGPPRARLSDYLKIYDAENLRTVRISLVSAIRYKES